MLADWLEKIKGFAKENRGDIFLFVSIVLISLASFGLGRLSVIWQPHPPVRITGPGTDEFKGLKVQSAKVESLKVQSLKVGAVVASKNGSSYHLPTCSGAKNIKSENIIKFNSAAEASAAGYKPAGNCPGLEE